MHGRRIRALRQYGILLCGELFAECSEEELERKYQRALQLLSVYLLWVAHLKIICLTSRQKMLSSQMAR